MCLIGIESLPALNNLPNILEVDGIDGIFVGPNDMSTSLGIPDQTDHPEYEEALRKVIALCSAKNVPVLIHHQSVELTQKWLREGARFVLYSSDRRSLHNAFRAEFGAIKAVGAEITGAGTDEITIQGKQELKADVDYTVIPDRIEAGTFLIAGAITAGDITVENIKPDHLNIVSKCLNDAGFKLDFKQNAIRIQSSGNSIQPVDITTAIYPGFPTDLQAQWMALMTKAEGQSAITEEIYTDRFTHIAELSRFGAHIRLINNQAIINGMKILKGAPVMSTDIRASASLILAALSSEGTSSITRVYHIDRGYDKIEEKLTTLCARIKRVKE